MHWNHRVMRYDDGKLAIHEVYYDDAGAVTGWCPDGAAVIAEDAAGLAKVLVWMGQAHERPVLDYGAGLPVVDAAGGE